MQDQTAQTNSRKLYVGNLPYSTTKEDLLSLFGQYGDITDAVVISDFRTKRSKGFGFVEFADDAAANAAAEALNGYEMDGRKLVVNVARPQGDRPRNGGGRSFNRGPRRDFGGDRSYGRDSHSDYND